MKLLSCKVDGFGCLRDRSFDFSSNPVCILSDNGTGKTTLTVFIKSMLYGLTDKNDRKKYTPWDGGTFGGTLEFESSKGRFRIERYFGKKASDDRFKLINLETGLESDDYSENIGVEIFGIDAESYAKSTYMPQGNKDFSTTTSITTKLGELIEASDDAKSFDSAVSLLEDYMRGLKLFKGRGGLIADLEDEKFATEKVILSLETDLRDVEDKKSDLKRIETESSETAKKLKELYEKREKITKIRVLLNTYENLKKSAEESEEKYCRALAAFGGNLPDDAEIDKILGDIEKLNYIKPGKRPDLEEIDNFKLKFGDISGAKAALNRVKNTSEKPSRNRLADILTIIGDFTTAAGTVLCLLTIVFNIKPTLPFGIALLAVGVPSIILGFIFRVIYKKDITKCKDELNNELLSFGYDASDVAAAIAQFESDLERYSYLVNAELSSRKEYEEKSHDAEYLSEKIAGFLKKYGVEPDGDLSDTVKKLRDGAKEAKELKKLAEARANDCEKFAKEHGIDGEQILEGIDDPNDEINQLSKRAETLNTLAGSIGADIKNLETRAEELPSLRYQTERIDAKIAEYTEKREIAGLAEQYLKEAKTSLSTKYLGKTKSNFGEIYEELTGKTSEFDIDTNFGVSFRETGGYRDSKVYSEGMRSIFAICMRLSLAKSLFGDEPAFLILDDPFTDLDGEKLARATAMLQKLSENYQIIYTTCHESRKI